MRIATVTTTRRPGDPIRSFVKYHRSIGVSHLFVFHEGTPDAAIEDISKLDAVTVLVVDDALRSEWRTLRSFAMVHEFLEREVMARQILNAECAVRRALAMGIDWLMHLDSDELVFPGDASLADQLEKADRANATEVVFLNHEAVPEAEEVGDYFSEVTLFKANADTTAERALALPFVAYRTGKAASRVSGDTVPWGVHRFRMGSGARRALRSKRGAILHYPSCGFSRFVEKYRMLGRFPDRWFDNVSISDNMGFHAAARDLILAGDMEGARALYRKRIMLSRLGTQRRSRLLEQGYLHRISQPATACLR